MSTVWTWQQAITQSDLKPTTRHVLLTLSTYMNQHGKSCYPTTKQLEKATGLSERSVCTHIAEARDKGWLKTKEHGFKGQKWANNEYEPLWPKRTEPNADALNLTTEGTEPNDIKALNEVQSRVPLQSGIKSGEVFEKLWNEFNPKLKASKRINKSEAKKIFSRRAKEHGLDKMRQAMHGYYNDPDIKKQNYQYARGIKFCLSGRCYEGYLDAPEPTSYIENRLAAQKRQELTHAN